MKHFPTHSLLAALPATAALVLTAVTPAQASAPGDTGNWLRLTVTEGDSRVSDSRGTLLLCDPPHGHSRATEACAELAAADGDLRAVPARKDTICSLVYAPVTAHARGQWNGHPVEYEKTFANRCVMGAETGAVFALDDAQPSELPDLPGL
ncbi:SSI family serine proteinase inhibitor [Streptomyces aurantiogriseus]|uniref:Subtilase-type protease inhibitor n=1 Tax=Streptomyces aurantiogriseus TaxID=66870 RepID=A0A918CJK1_9ACTN|nr:SSI family serine proteinase inhibitor [Streptomyces aurantiogriseus]GGR26788.1 subtilase-type protease inhibitor [Streptomyces aurantiogriseus]